jgi:hypothetical protein
MRGFPPVRWVGQDKTRRLRVTPSGSDLHGPTVRPIRRSILRATLWAGREDVQIAAWRVHPVGMAVINRHFEAWTDQDHIEPFIHQVPVVIDDSVPPRRVRVEAYRGGERVWFGES